MFSKIQIKHNRTSITQTSGFIFQAYPKPRVLLKLFMVPAIISKYNIGAPKMLNNFGAIKLSIIVKGYQN